MTCKIINNLNGELLAVCECGSVYMTNSFYRFIRSMMFLNASASIENRDISGFIDDKEVFRFVTYTDGSRIIGNHYVNGELIRNMTIAD